MEIVKDPYYAVGNIDDIVISQSLLQHIDPKRGGSPRKFQDTLINKKDDQTTAMLRGSIFHLWAEDKDKFAVSEAVKPSEKLGLVADLVIEKFNLLDETSKQEKLMMPEQLILQCAKELKYQPTYGDAALIKNTASIGPYLFAMNDPKNVGKIILTATMKEQIEKCIESLTGNTYAHRLLFWKDEFSDIQYFKEIDIFWNEVIDGKSIKCKGKLDDVIINHETKTIDINDIKTTGGSAYNFEGAFKAYRLDVQFAMYTRAIKAQFPEFANYKFNYRHIVVETSGLFQTVVHRWSKDIIGEAQHDLDQLFRRVTSAIDNKFRMSIEEIQGKGEIMHKELAA